MSKKSKYNHSKSDDFMACGIDMIGFLKTQSKCMEFISQCDMEANLVSQYAQYLKANLSKSELAFSAAKMGLLVMSSELSKLDQEGR
jgi:hypothetical protein